MSKAIRHIKRATSSTTALVAKGSLFIVVIKAIYYAGLGGLIFPLTIG
jgi:hypothetical protein